MATITDDDLKMFQERAKTEFASRCDTGGIAWDSVIWDLCNEVRRLRSVSKEHGDCAKLREALKHIKDRLPHMLQYMRVHWEDASAGGYFDELMLVIDAALATEKEGGNDGR